MGKRLSECRAAEVYRRSLYRLVLAPRRLFIRPLNSFISRYSVSLSRSTAASSNTPRATPMAAAFNSIERTIN